MCNRGWHPCYFVSTPTSKLLAAKTAAGTATIMPPTAGMLLHLEMITATETELADHFLLAKVLKALRDFGLVFTFSTLALHPFFGAPLYPLTSESMVMTLSFFA